MTSSKPAQDNGYTIGTVAKMTGLSTQVIRAWERRYEAVVAERSDNGRRVYGQAEVEKLSLLKSLTDMGTPISTIADLDASALRARVSEMDSMTTPSINGAISVVVLGPFMPGMLEQDLLDAYGFDLRLAGNDHQRFSSQVKNLEPDVMVIEINSLNDTVVEEIIRLKNSSRTRALVVAYGFGRSANENRLADQGVMLVRTPLAPDELARSILAAATLPARRKVARKKTEPRKKTTPFEIKPRQFTDEELARLSTASSSIECECPRHLTTILNTLTAFEVYSTECEDTDEKEAALHRYLHDACGRARTIMEDALAHLIEVDQLKY